MTRAELISEISKCSTDTLQQLYDYSKFIIVPQEDLALNATMGDMVDKAHELADRYFPEWTDRSKSDFGEFLVELFALFSEKDFWYINAFANEGIFTKMRSYSNAYIKAISMGYTPRETVPASIQANIRPQSISKNPRTIAPYAIRINVDGTEFTNTDEISIRELSMSENVKFEQITRNSDTITFNGYCIFIKRENVIRSSVRLLIDGTYWVQVNHFGDSSSSSQVFVCYSEEYGGISIFFGNNINGKLPSIGTSVVVEYNTTDADSIPNVKLEDLPEPSIVANDETNPIESVVLLSSIKGGEKQDSLSELINGAIAYNSTNRAIMNLPSMSTMLDTLVGRGILAKYHVSYDVFLFKVSIVPAYDSTSTEEEVAAIVKAFIEPYLAIGYLIDVNKAAKVSIDVPVKLNVVCNYGVDSEYIKNAVSVLMNRYFDVYSDGEFGRGFEISEITSYIKQNLSGIISINSNYSGKSIMPNEIMTPITSLEVSVNVKD